nr:class I tRNA ligase family protein [Bradyrhizobium sp. 2S1]MCK7664907.1 class I tRNA ligase family protein [Bradyrhizobium sp. 2S1]
MRTLITAGPPTSNGDLHLGHLSGPYTAGDIHARYLRMRRRDVSYISAADDHQSYVALKAAQTGRSPQDVADEYGAVIKHSLQRADVAMTYFGQPSRSRRYVELLERFVATLYAKGHLIARSTEIPYCAPCERLLFEAHIKGHCSFCGQGSDGGICEACGHPNAGSDLKSAHCAGCGTAPATSKPVTRLFFSLDAHKDYLRRYTQTAEMNTHARALCDELLAGDLPDVAVTQPGNWGIVAPIAGFENQRISAWFELGPHYLAITDMLNEHQGGPDWREWWTGNTEIIQCFGFDSAYFHIILFPALFHAFDEAITPPKGFIVNEFYRLDGRKFSTSRKHALWASEFLQQYSSDAARFHLCLTRPETEQTNFTLAEFHQSLDGELIGVWDSWLAGLALRVADNRAPPARISTVSQMQFYQRLAAATREVASSYEVAGFSTQRAARQLGGLVREAVAFASSNAHYAADRARRDEYHTGVALELAAARTLAMLAAPIMPQFGARLWADLGERAPVEQAEWEQMPGLIAADTPVELASTGYFLPSRQLDKVLAA